MANPRKQWKTMFFLMFGSVVMMGLFGMGDAYALTADGAVKNANNLSDVIAGQSETLKKMAEWASIVIAIFTPLIAILLKLISSLMTDSYILGNNSTGGYDIAQLLYEVWNISRSIVNYLIMAAVMFSAVMGLIPKFGEKYDLKKSIGKIIIAAVMVNLTWFGVRVIMDASEVATHAVYSLPQTVFAGNKAFEEAATINPCTITSDKGHVDQTGNCSPTYILVNPKGNFKTLKTESGNNQYSQASQSTKDNAIKNLNDQITKTVAEKAKATKEADQKKYDAILTSLKKQKESIEKIDTAKIVDYGAITIFWDDFNYEQFNSGTIAPLFAYSIMQIQKLPMIATQSSELKEAINAETNIVDNGWIALLINSVIALVVMVMMIVLFLMMLIVLIFRIIIIWVNIMVLPFWVFSQIGIFGGIFDKMKGKYVGIDPLIKSIFAPVIMGLPMVIGFILIQAGNSYGMMGDISNGFIMQGPLINGIATIHQAFYYALCIGVMWIGSKAAILSISEGTFFNGIIKTISDGTDNFMKGIASAPMYMQWMPIMGSDGKVKTASLANIFGQNGLGSVARYFQNQPDALAPDSKDAVIANATTNEDLVLNKINYEKGKGVLENPENVIDTLSSQKDKMNNIFKAPDATPERIMDQLVGEMLPIKEAITKNVLTLEEVYKMLNHGSKRKEDSILNDATYTRLFNPTGARLTASSASNTTTATATNPANSATTPAAPQPASPATNPPPTTG